jgi:predicted phosphate transport protein (TIGR00153 family)
MLGTLFNLFGRSPFAPLQSHMDKVAGCVHLLQDLFENIEAANFPAVEEVAAQIAELEHQADIIKNHIRSHLPKSLFLPIDRSHLLEILALQDRIADKAEDVAVLATVKPLQVLTSFKMEFKEFLHKNLVAFDSSRSIIKEMHDLLESSFGGIEAEKVRAMIDNVAYEEHEVDLIQRQLLKKIFQSENEMSYTTFYLWQKICETLAAISNLSENLAFRVRMTLELK